MLVATLPALALSMGSCGSSSSAESEMAFVSKCDSTARLIPDFYGDSVYALSTYSIIWPEKIGTNDISALHDSIMAMAFNQYGSNGLCDAAEKWASYNMSNADSDTVFASVSVPLSEAMAADRQNFASSVGTVSSLRPDMLVLDITNSYYYYGAAHGMYMRYYINYSIAVNQVLTAENMFLPEAHDEVLHAVNNAARMEFDGQLYVDSIPDYSTIRISDNDIYFVYQPYEVAPYSRGVVEIPVGIYELVDALSPLGRKALSIGKDD